MSSNLKMMRPIGFVTSAGLSAVSLNAACSVFRTSSSIFLFFSVACGLPSDGVRVSRVPDGAGVGRGHRRVPHVASLLDGGGCAGELGERAEGDGGEDRRELHRDCRTRKKEKEKEQEGN